jgi:hypothetical protein
MFDPDIEPPPQATSTASAAITTNVVLMTSTPVSLLRGASWQHSRARCTLSACADEKLIRC